MLPTNTSTVGGQPCVAPMQRGGSLIVPTYNAPQFLRPPRSYDVTAVEDISLTAIAGRDAWRRAARPQTVIATVRVAADTSAAALHDDLRQAYDYSPLVRTVTGAPLDPCEHPVDLALALHKKIAASLAACGGEEGLDGVAAMRPPVLGLEVFLNLPKAVHLVSGGLLVKCASGVLAGPQAGQTTTVTAMATATAPVSVAVALRGIMLSLIVGVGPFERIQQQAVSVDVDLHGCARIDYAAIVGALSHIAACPASRACLTVERLTAEMAAACLRVVRRARLPGNAGAVSVRLCKVAAVQVARHAVIEITRDLEWLRREFGEDDDSESQTDDDELAAGEVVFLALGSNAGDRALNIDAGLRAIAELDGVRLCDTSFLYETKPMYLLDQDRFFNAVCKIKVSGLSPNDLLLKIKEIELRLGRDPCQVRNGPRAIDIDIITFGEQVISTPDLKVPHVALGERDFVLRPLADIAPGLIIPQKARTVSELLAMLSAETSMARKSSEPSPGAVLRRVTPLNRRDGKPYPVGGADAAGQRYHGQPGEERLLRWGQHTLVMGILNVTPNSFSDGGCNFDPDIALQSGLRMARDGAEIIDVGGLSTSPQNLPCSEAEELRRVTPVVERLRKALDADSATRHVVISVDTYRPAVARAVARLGAEMINDVTGGLGMPGDAPSSETMADVCRDLRLALVLMHMRGTPHTMDAMTEYSGGDCVTGIARELAARVRAVVTAGLPRWLVLVDPGLGFAKNGDQCFEVLRRLPELHEGSEGVTTLPPMLLGPSRKRFLRSVLRDAGNVRMQDEATSAAVVAAIISRCPDVVRVHDVAIVSEAVRVADRIVGRYTFTS